MGFAGFMLGGLRAAYTAFMPAVLNMLLLVARLKWTFQPGQIRVVAETGDLMWVLVAPG
jgi:hypothetical protein